MGRMVKCYYCKKSEDKDKTDLIFQLPNKKYAHIKCYEIQAKENKERDDLIEEIKRIHNIVTIPHSFYPFLQDLRNGTDRCNRSSIKKKKQGYRFLIIKKTYQMYEKTIKDGLRLKKITNEMDKLLYSYAIVTNKIGFVRNKLHQEYLIKQSKEKAIDEPIKNIDEEVKVKINHSSKPTYNWLRKDD